MTSMSKNLYIDKLDNIVNKNNNIYLSAIKMKPVDVIRHIYWLSKEINEKDPKFKIGDNVTISKYKKTFAKNYVPNWSKEVFVIKKVEKTVPWTYVISSLKGEESFGTISKKKIAKNNSRRV